MEVLDASRWQFGVTTVYHFLFVPLTIGLGFLVAGFQTAWVRTGRERWLRLTKFYGKLFLINFAMGVVTGIVQEFQFGMNWSAYSRFVGDVFGAPLAIEGLLAFFLESTFLGLWIFGWDKLPRRVHLACIWIAAAGSALSAYFILAANSFMQWPVGYRLSANGERAELTDIVALLTNKVTLVTFPHTLFGCFLTAGALVMSVGLWHLFRRKTPEADRAAYRFGARIGAVVTLVAMAGMFVSGDIQGKVMTETQPMRMAAAEGLYETARPAPFSLFTVGTLDGTAEVYSLKLPGLLSFLGTGDFDGEVLGVNDVQAQYEAEYGPGDYRPNIPLAYWSFRGMIGFGVLAAFIALWALWDTRRGRDPAHRWLRRLAPLVVLFPLIGNTLGWIFTETGRQPWLVFGLLRTADGVSPTVGLTEILASLTAFTLLYGVLAVIEARLLIRYAKKGLPDIAPATAEDEDGGDRASVLAY